MKENKSTIARNLRKSILLLAAATVISIPATSSAAVSGTLLNSKKPSEEAKSPEAIYARLQNLSDDACESSDLKVTGDLHRPALEQRPCLYFPLQPGPLTTRPGVAPVCSPSLSTCSPLTKTWTIPVAYWCGLTNVA